MAGHRGENHSQLAHRQNLIPRRLGAERDIRSQLRIGRGPFLIAIGVHPRHMLAYSFDPPKVFGSSLSGHGGVQTTRVSGIPSSEPQSLNFRL